MRSQARKLSNPAHHGRADASNRWSYPLGFGLVLAHFTELGGAFEQPALLEAKLAALAKGIRENRGKAKDVESLKKVVSSLNQNCDSCHERYQVTNR